MTMHEMLMEIYKPEHYILTDAEYQAVYDWIDGEKDNLSGDLKEGLLKLVNGEEKRRMFGADWSNPTTVADAGRKGGSAKTARKAAAVAENGKKGGRPRKNPL